MGGYHNAAENSTGFKKEVPAEAAKGGDKPKPKIAEHLQSAVDATTGPYEYLLAKSTIRSP